MGGEQGAGYHRPLAVLEHPSWVETGIVILAIPLSLVGAVWLLWLLGYHLSVAVWIGMIALAGLDAETGVVMLRYLRLSHDARLRTGQLQPQAELDDAIVDGAARRIRPKVMTMLLGLGGLVSSFLLELIVYPAIAVPAPGPSGPHWGLVGGLVERETSRPSSCCPISP